MNRPRSRRTAWALASGVVLASAIAAGQSQTPLPTSSRDPFARQQTGEKAPAGVIAGHVLNDRGRPISRARVLLTASELPQGRSAMTDASGAFRFAGLRAGRYTLTASKAGYLTLSYGQRRPLQAGTPLQLADSQQLKSVDFRLPSGGAVSGRVADENGDPAAGVTVQVLRVQYTDGTPQLVPTGIAQTDDRGQYRAWGLNPGSYYVTASSRPGRPLGEPGADIAADEPVGYAPTYYPGVTSVHDARRVTVGLGDDALDVNFGLLLVRTAQVRGRVLNSSGSAAWSGAVSLMAEGDGGWRGGPLGASYRTSIADDGGFSIVGVAPGRYILSARSTNASEPPEFATVPVTIDEADVTVDIALAPSASVSGTISVVSTGSGTLPDFEQFRISMPAVHPAEPGAQPTARPDEEGKFSIAAVPQGLHWIRGEAPRGWTLASVIRDGRDVIDTPFEIRGGQTVAGVTAVFTDRLAIVQGTLTDQRGQPLTDHTVLAFSTDSRLWHAQSRQILTARPDQNGRFEIRGLPPGEYYLAAVDPAEPDEWFEPTFLDRHRAGAARLTLSAGDVKTQDFRAVVR